MVFLCFGSNLLTGIIVRGTFHFHQLLQTTALMILQHLHRHILGSTSASASHLVHHVRLVAVNFLEVFGNIANLNLYSKDTDRTFNKASFCKSPMVSYHQSHPNGVSKSVNCIFLSRLVATVR